MRARAAATPGPSSVSRTGITRLRTRDRVNRSSALCGSCQNSMPSARQAASVCARVRSSSGRSNGGRRRLMPAIERPPEPRASPSSTVSAWSSRVWPSSTPAAAPRLATSSKTAYLASRAAASGPCPRCSTPTRTATVSSAPRPAICCTTWSACCAERSCRPWSTVAPTTRRGCLRASKAAAARSARESAPPEHATTTGPSGRAVRVRRTASRTAATAGSSGTARRRAPGGPRRPGRRSPRGSAAARARSTPR